MKRIFFFCVLAILLSQTSVLFAQHEHHMQMPAKDSTKTTSTPKKKPKTDKHTEHNMQPGNPQPQHEHEMSMTSSFSKNLPMSRDGSGTSWVPDASHMYMLMNTSGKTNVMFHWNVFPRYTSQDLFNQGSRGNSKFGAPNWFMGMLNRPVGSKGLFSASAMISLDRISEGGEGYPLLFQSGETWKGNKLVDRQHPHDLFSALTVGYSYALNKNADVYGYFGYPGEPALGPPVFMHRNSSLNNPDAPLGHHWQDASHITFGVGTIGFRYKIFKAEGSIFTGREPDENRFNFDRARFDSYSYRVSVNPGENWALQFSQGFLHSPEVAEPGLDITRTTASILYSKHISCVKAHFDGALIWGLNSPQGHPGEHSLLAEGNLQFKKNALFGRYEFVQKSAEELDLSEQDIRYSIHAVTLGYSHLLLPGKSFEIYGGVKATLNLPDERLQSQYGNLPIGLGIHLQLRPPVHGH